MSITLSETQLEITWTPLLPEKTARKGYGIGGYGTGQLYGETFTTVILSTTWAVDTTQ